MNAAEIAAQLDLKKYARSWRGACPVCSYPDAFIVRQGRTQPLLSCVSCNDRGAIIGFLRELGGGGWERPTPEVRGEDHRQREPKIARACRIWDAALPVLGSPAETYLSGRGIEHIARSPFLRYAPSIGHPEGGPNLPALVALVLNAEGERVAIHRTYIRRDGSGKADVTPAKASLGPVWGGLIWLETPSDDGAVMIGEGIESAASAGLLMGLPAAAALSAGNLGAGAVLPAEVRTVTIAADPDIEGATRAAEAADRWQREGRRVRIATPTGRGDWNDLLLAGRADG